MSFVSPFYKISLNNASRFRVHCTYQNQVTLIITVGYIIHQLNKPQCENITAFQNSYSKRSRASRVGGATGIRTSSQQEYKPLWSLCKYHVIAGESQTRANPVGYIDIQRKCMHTLRCRGTGSSVTCRGTRQLAKPKCTSGGMSMPACAYPPRPVAEQQRNGCKFHRQPDAMSKDENIVV